MNHGTQHTTLNDTVQDARRAPSVPTTYTSAFPASPSSSSVSTSPQRVPDMQGRSKIETAQIGQQLAMVGSCSSDTGDINTSQPSSHATDVTSTQELWTVSPTRASDTGAQATVAPQTNSQRGNHNQEHTTGESPHDFPLSTNTLSVEAIREKLQKLCMQGLLDNRTGERVLSELLGDAFLSERNEQRTLDAALSERTPVSGREDDDNGGISKFLINERSSDCNDSSSVQPAPASSVRVAHDNAGDDGNDNDTQAHQEEEDHGASDLKGSEHAAGQAGESRTGTVSTSSSRRDQEDTSDHGSRHEGSTFDGGYTLETAATHGSMDADDESDTTENDADDLRDQIAPLPFSTDALSDHQTERRKDGMTAASSATSEDFSINPDEDNLSRKTELSFSNLQLPSGSSEPSDLRDINLEAYDEDANARYTCHANSSVCAVAVGASEDSSVNETHRKRYMGQPEEEFEDEMKDDDSLPYSEGEDRVATSAALLLYQNSWQSGTSTVSTVAQDPSQRRTNDAAVGIFSQWPPTVYEHPTSRLRSVSQDDGVLNMFHGFCTNISGDGVHVTYNYPASSGLSVLSTVGSDFGDDQGSHVEIASVEARPPTPLTSFRQNLHINNHHHSIEGGQGNSTHCGRTALIGSVENLPSSHESINEPDNPDNNGPQSCVNRNGEGNFSVVSGISRLSTTAVQEGSVGGTGETVGVDQLRNYSWSLHGSENGVDIPRQTYEQNSLAESEPPAGTNLTDRGYSENGSAEDHENNRSASVRFEANPQSMDDAIIGDVHLIDGDGVISHSHGSSDSVEAGATDRAISQASGRSFPDTNQFSEGYSEDNDEKSEGAPDVMGDERHQNLVDRSCDNTNIKDHRHVSRREHRERNKPYRPYGNKRFFSPVKHRESNESADNLLDPADARALVLNAWFYSRPVADRPIQSSNNQVVKESSSKRRRPATARHARDIGSKNDRPRSGKVGFARPLSAYPTRQEQRNGVSRTSSFLEEEDSDEDDSRLLYIGNFQPSSKQDEESYKPYPNANAMSQSGSHNHNSPFSSPPRASEEQVSTNGMTSPMQRSVIRRPIASSRLQRAIHNNKQPYMPSPPERRALQQELAEEIPELRKT